MKGHPAGTPVAPEALASSAGGGPARGPGRLAALWREAGEHRRELIRGSAAGAATRGVELAAKFLFQLLIARQLGAAASGLVFLALAAGTVMATLSRFGLDLALTRHVAAALARGAEEGAEGARALARRGLSMIAGSAALAALALFFLAEPIAADIFAKPELARPLRWMAIGVVAFPLLHGFAAILGGAKRVGQSQFLLSSSWSLLAILGMLVAGHDADSATAVVALSMAASAAGGGVLAWLALRRLPGTAVAAAEDEPAPAYRTLLLRTAWPLGAVDLAQTFVTFVPTIILGVFAASDAVGGFAIANRLALTVTAVLGGAAAMSLPQFSELHALGRREALAATARDLMRITVLLGFPMASVLMLFPGPILSLIGPGFAAAAPTLRILLLGYYPACLFFYAPALLSMTGHERDLRAVYFGVVPAGIAACFVLIPMLGDAGAAIATALMVGSAPVAAALIVARRLGLAPSAMLGRPPAG